MLNRNYQVFTGTQLYNDFGITETNGRNLEKDGLFCMLFVVSPMQGEDSVIDGQKLVDGYSRIYGPFFHLADAQMWCDNINKIFEELSHELGNKFVMRNKELS